MGLWTRSSIDDRIRNRRDADKGARKMGIPYLCIMGVNASSRFLFDRKEDEK